MIYLYWYLAIGVAVVVLNYGAHRLSQNGDSESFAVLLDAVDPDRDKLWNRILDALVQVLVVFAVVIIWPVAAYIEYKGAFSNKNTPPMDEDLKKFVVEAGHLLEQLTVREIEARETVYDPLGAAPNLPFGHLNVAWRTFLEGRVDTDEVWSFAARWQTTWGQHFREGYVLVQSGNPGAHFLTVWKYLPDEEDAMTAGL